MTTMGEHKPYGFYERFVKRPQDFLCALLAIIVLSPVLLIVAFLVRIKTGSPILFIQQRPGVNEKVFKLYKFHTMTEERDIQKMNLVRIENFFETCSLTGLFCCGALLTANVVK